MKPPFPIETISEFLNNNHFLSNFYPCLGSSTEHLYQAAKTDDPMQKKFVMAQPSAALAKKVGRTVTIKENWEKEKLQVMLDIVRQKFNSSVDLRTKLLNTGDALLIEGNYWHDTFWGQCHCSKHNWEGENHLGEILMQVRAELGGHWKSSRIIMSKV